MKFKTKVCLGMVTALMWSPIYQNPSRIITAKISFSLALSTHSIVLAYPYDQSSFQFSGCCDAIALLNLYKLL